MTNRVSGMTNGVSGMTRVVIIAAVESALFVAPLWAVVEIRKRDGHAVHR